MPSATASRAVPTAAASASRRRARRRSAPSTTSSASRSRSTARTTRGRSRSTNSGWIAGSRIQRIHRIDLQRLELRNELQIEEGNPAENLRRLKSELLVTTFGERSAGDVCALRAIGRDQRLALERNAIANHEPRDIP